MNRREMMKKSLMKQTKTLSLDKAQVGSSLKFPLPDQRKLWKPDNGNHFIDIIPYPVGKNDPNPQLKEGEFSFVFQYYVHRGLGVDFKKSAICLQSMYKKPCPICEHRSELEKNDSDEDMIKKLYAKRRELYNVWVQDNEKEQDKGIQIMEVASYYMSNELKPLWQAPTRPGQQDSMINFTAPDKDGKTIGFGIGTKLMGKATIPDYYGHRFVDRDYDIPENILNQALSLDNLIVIPSYKEVYELYWGEEYKDGKEEVVPEVEETVEVDTTIDLDTMSKKEMLIFIRENGIADQIQDYRKLDEEELRVEIDLIISN